MPEISNEQVADAAFELIELVKARINQKSPKYRGTELHYALSYLRLCASLEDMKATLSERGYDAMGYTLERALAIQCAYALSNLTGLKGDKAKELKQVLKDYNSQHSRS